MLVSQVFKNFSGRRIFESRYQEDLFFPANILHPAAYSSGYCGVHVASGQIKFSDICSDLLTVFYGRDADVCLLFILFISFLKQQIFRIICKIIPKSR